MESINELVIEAQVLEALRTCFDPEIPVNIYELGLIYNVNVEEGGAVTITMTLTSPHCPAAESMPAEIEEKVKAVSGVSDVKIDWCGIRHGIQARCLRRHGFSLG